MDQPKPFSESETNNLASLENKRENWAKIDRISTTIFFAVVGVIGLELVNLAIGRILDSHYKPSFEETVALGASLGIGNLVGFMTIISHWKQMGLNLEIEMFLKDKLSKISKTAN